MAPLAPDSIKTIQAAGFGGGEISHGFFTRKGGVSDGIYKGLNVGFGSDDSRDNVAENRKRAMDSFGLPLSALRTLYQVHSATVVTVARDGVFDDPAPQADAMVTAAPGVVLGILTADCVPVLFADSQNKIIGAAHSGWKGAVSGVLEATVTAMCDLGAERKNIHAAIGPAIAQASYEVGPEFPAPFLENSADNARFFTPSQKAAHHMFDLTGFVRQSLEGMSLGGIEHVAQDTYGAPELFYSYRRATHRGEPDYGRGLSAIALTGS
ncbi:MAG: YfiH family protein [Alphaproteobacteria bacterium]|jgi:YfiH family protein